MTRVCHLKKSGKKDELVKHVEDALKLNLPINPKIDGGKWYDVKVNKNGSTTGPSNSDQSIQLTNQYLLMER